MKSARFYAECMAMALVYVAVLYLLCRAVFGPPEKTPRTSAVPNVEAGRLSNQDKLATDRNQPARPLPSRANPTNAGSTPEPAG